MESQQVQPAVKQANSLSISSILNTKRMGDESYFNTRAPPLDQQTGGVGTD